MISQFNQMTPFNEMKQLYEETERDLIQCHQLLIDLWKETGDPRIKQFFQDQGGIYFDGKMQFVDKE